MIAPKQALFVQYERYLKAQGMATNTIKIYLSLLKNIPTNPDEIESYFGDKDLKAKKSKVAAYRSYLNYLDTKNKITPAEYKEAFKTIKPPKRRGNHVSEKKWSEPKTKWPKIIKKAPNKVARFGIWLGFNFGLRLSEIIHSRVQDINFEKQEILVRCHKKSKRHEAWAPKYNRERQIPFTKSHERILRRFIDSVREKDLDHDYLLWTPLNGNMVNDRNFWRWCKKAGVRPHVLRYSFATHYYEVSKDVKLVSDLLGHANVSTTSDYLQLGRKETMDKARELFERV